MDFSEDDFEPRHRGGRSWTHRLGGILRAMIAFAFCAIVIGLFWPELQRQREVTRHNAELEAQISQEEQRLASRTRELDWLRNDPQYVELLARDRLNLQREGETIFRFDLPDRLQSAPR